MMKIIVFLCMMGATSAFSPSVQPRVTTTRATSTAIAAFDMDSDTMIGVAVAVGAIGAAAAAFGSSGNGDGDGGKQKNESVEPEIKIDVSIPYNAAALLAFDAFTGRAPFDAGNFKKYEVLFIEKNVAEVAAKKAIRDLDGDLSSIDASLSKLSKEISSA